MAEAPTGTVTLLFSDIEGSTRLLQRTGDAYADLLAEHRRLLREAFEQHHGFVVDSEGDALFVAFASAAEAASPPPRPSGRSRSTPGPTRTKFACGWACTRASRD